MARLVEDSGCDEFPDLGQLLENVKAAPRSLAKTSREATVRASRGGGKREGGEGEKTRRKVSSQLRGEETVNGRVQEDEGEELDVEPVTKEKPRPRKRVLNQKNDNPLLRPLSGLSTRRVSPDAVEERTRVKVKEAKRKKDPTKLESKISAMGLEEDVGRGKRAPKVKLGTKTVPKAKKAQLLEVDPEEEESSICCNELPTKDAKRNEVERVEAKPKRSYTTKFDSSQEDSSASCNEAPAEEAKGKEIKRKETRPKKSYTTKFDSDKEDSAVSCNELPVEKAKDKKVKRPEGNPKRSYNTKFDSDDEDDFASDGLSDFIVSDSTFLDEESVVEEVPAQRSVRRLVKGRRPRKDDSDDSDLESKMGKLTFEDDPFARSREASWENDLKKFTDNYEAESSPPVLKLPKKIPDTTQRDVFKPERVQVPTSRPTTSGSEVENPFTLKFSPPPHPSKVTKETRFKTPPGSPEPKPRGLVSPKKLPRAPATPHRPSMDAFWAQDVINDWNDEYSPRKNKTPAASKILFSPEKHKLPAKADGKAMKEAKLAFEASKHEVAEKFLRELDEAVTGGEVGRLAASTGGVKIIWSNKLNTTAGRANWKRETIRSSVPLSSNPSNPSSTTSSLQLSLASTSKTITTNIIYRHHASIELASKVIDCTLRLHNVIAHEYCHLANFMISNIKTNPHGKEFKVWARKVTDWGRRKGYGGKGGEGFEVTTKHTYEIEYKYIWECSGCSVLYQRHSKSVDPSRHQCGSCKGRLVQIKPAPRGGNKSANGTVDGTAGDGGAGKVGKPLSEYQLFVKDNMKLIKKENPGSPQKEIMGEVGRRYRAFKAAKSTLGSGGAGMGPVDVDLDDSQEGDGLDGRAEGTPGVELGGVVRKLGFLDVTGDSP